MSLNIAPHIPQTIVNAATPTTEALVHTNAIKEVIPAPVQTEAAVPQKSREQDNRAPAFDNPTYDDIQKPDPKVIPEQDADDQQETSGQSQQDDGDDQAQEDSEVVGQAPDSKPSDTDDEQEDKQNEANSAAKQRAEDRKEQAEQAAELKQIQQLQRRDSEVRAHEQAHAAVGGGYAGSPQYEYETGPNGKKYAVSGEVSIDVSKEASPQNTIAKMQTVRAAALAPAEPSAQDRKVAAEATQILAEARAELIRETSSLSQDRSNTLSEENDDSSSSIAANQDEGGAIEAASPARSLDEAESDLGSSQQTRQADPVNRVIANRYRSSFSIEKRGFRTVA